ncbi:malto-oligosyltrehalose synthase [Olivibacter sp. CPCC 100613]|uniref:malto-oligosyltrehalose synthase n=1 Tax=Olivibacter sp. CPCC 100613 TaxID=3079931 RepID=UPI002FFA88D1
MGNVFNPIASYRVQFHKNFTFKDALKLVPYWQSLGIKSLYASPIFEAVSGSTHGYDVINPNHVNPEIGTLEELRVLTAKCKACGLAWIQDIVPNHMAFHPTNTWLMDVMEKGAYSSFARVFDTSIDADFFHGAVMVPFLGSTLEKAINQKDIKLISRGNKLCLAYYDQLYPVNLNIYSAILDRLLLDVEDEGKQVKIALGEVLQSQQGRASAFETSWQGFLNEWKNYTQVKEVQNRLRHQLRLINNDHLALLHLCEQQYYRLCSWRETDKNINYRRFFTVNGLVCTQVQKDDVFLLAHQFVKQMVDEDCFQGLRIDHIDGLFDPEKYLYDLRCLVGPQVYIVVEKILEQHEKLPLAWPIQGTSGYDYLALSNKLFTAKEKECFFDKFYEQLVGRTDDIYQQIVEKKSYILQKHMQGETTNLFKFFQQSNFLSKKASRAFDAVMLKEAISSVLIFCPVYRFYGNSFPLKFSERKQLKAIFQSIRHYKPNLIAAVDVLEELLLTTPKKSSQGFHDRLLYFYQRLMQFSGPLMAKGVEDTLMYTFNRFIGHNEVGSSLSTFGLSKKDFHRAMEERQRNWPLAMNGTATHDTKRGEDARARLQALSCLSEKWQRTVSKLERELKLNPQVIPEMNDRYFIYQTLLASYPSTEDDDQDYAVRLSAYLEKALREAKINSDWVEPNHAYEKKCIDFALSLLEKKGDLWPLWTPLLEEVNKQGVLNSLGQVLLKITVPGVPDFYQGTEYQDLSFVDPDNRRRINYRLRKQSVQSIKKGNIDLLHYWQEFSGSHVKLALTVKLLHYRSQNAILFEKGLYIPLKVKGRYRKHILAFCRRFDSQWCVTIVPLYLAQLCADQQCTFENINWKDTRIDWPEDIPINFVDVLANRSAKVEGTLLMADLFKKRLPLVVLHIKQEEKKRAAGILLPIASLPSAFGIGDLGPHAQHFASQLSKAGQSYWQLLPLNPTGANEYYSPYSAYSVFAGNPILISPEVLARKGLLSAADLTNARRPIHTRIAYDEAIASKRQLLQDAFLRFMAAKNNSRKGEFVHFMQKEKSWLDDFAMYLLIKKQQEGKAWYKWPRKLKLRDKQTLNNMAKKYTAELLELKWQQYEFFDEWKDLKASCEALSIQLLGDLPIYVNYDSVDVWTNRHLFSVNEDGELLGVAGVPPDYFNAEGQLWGMPTFNWEAHAKEKYTWWLARLRKNLEWYHLIRLDHFRAFYDYWEVSASEKNAVQGTWRIGPRDKLFNLVKEKLGTTALIAEDLGDISPGVYELRDRFDLPGMKVLQFAFGDDTPHSLHIPHQYPINSVVYTGTHDNNTVVGWYKEELDRTGKGRLAYYQGHKVSDANISREMIRLAYASVAKLAIIPMQDVLSLGKEARMNTPATTGINWKWRLLDNQFDQKHIKWLRKLANTYAR